MGSGLSLQLKPMPKIAPARPDGLPIPPAVVTDLTPEIAADIAADIALDIASDITADITQMASL